MSNKTNPNTIVDLPSIYMLLADEGGKEEREVLSDLSERGFILTEVTEGETTKETYGTRQHRHAILIELENLDAAIAALGGGVSAPQAAARFFSSKDVFLSDVLDALDAAGVHYRYQSTGPDGMTVIRSS